MTPAPQLIVNLTRENVLCDNTAIADRLMRRMRGLLGRDALPAGEGILLIPTPSIHTAFMRFPIDVVFIDRDLRVLKVLPELGPWRTASARHARSTLELAAGECAKRGVTAGDQLAIDSGADRIAPGADPAEADGVDDLLSPPVRVLLISRDRRFRSVAAALLERRGFAVAVGHDRLRVAELAAEQRVDVVVLDASDSLTGAAYQAARIEQMAPQSGVIVVAEQFAGGLASMPVLPKWGSFDVLCTAIEDACRAPKGAHFDARR